MDWCLEMLLWNYTGSGTVGGPEAYQDTHWTNTYWQQSARVTDSTCCENTAFWEEDSESYCISQFDEQSSVKEEDLTLSSFDDLLNAGKRESRFGVNLDPVAQNKTDEGDPALCIDLKYNYSTQSLDVTIMECRDLPVVDGRKQHSNPYVKSYLVVAKIKYGKRKTRVMPATANPRFYELFRYCISKADMADSVLLVAVWHYNKYGRNFCLGEVTIPLADSRCSDLCPRWYKIEQKDSYHSCFMI